MATLKAFICPKCSEAYDAFYTLNKPLPTLCPECKRKQKIADRETFLADRASLTTEERLALLETDEFDRKHELAIQPRIHDILIGAGKFGLMSGKL